VSSGAGGLAENDTRRMYGDLAWAWPIISPPEDYVEEAEEILRWMRRHVSGNLVTLLHLGTGGGHIDFTLKRHVRVTGVDLSDEMLSLAAKLNPEVRYVRGDMRDISLGEQFDAVLVADSIAYMLREVDLLAAFRTAFAHLRPGGMFVTYAEDTSERFVQNAATCSAHRDGGTDIVLVENHFDPDRSDATYESTYVYLIRKDGRLDVAVDRHLSGLFPLETWTRLLGVAGFEIVEKPESPVAIHFICRKS
jgi:SAM-dependent methyltransferase